MEDALYWIWLQQALGIGSRKVDALLEANITPHRFYTMSAQEREGLGLFTTKELEKIQEVDLRQGEAQLEKAKKLGCTVLTPDHPDFPESLLHISGIPCVLYGKGDFGSLQNALLLTIVGTRKFTRYGYMTSHCLSRDLAAAGCVIVSGMAHGNDYAAHVGALSVRGRTLGILACGFDISYPAAHGKLRSYMLEHDGLLLTEFPFGVRPHPYSFSVRNRILSGISKGVIVTQSSQKSGTLITVGHALEQNRDVFAVPGNVFDPSMSGCNKLIHDGAKIVLDAWSVLNEYAYCWPEGTTEEQMREKLDQVRERQHRVRMPEAPIHTPFYADPSAVRQGKARTAAGTDKGEQNLVMYADIFAVSHAKEGKDSEQDDSAYMSEQLQKSSVLGQQEKAPTISPMLTAAALKGKKERASGGKMAVVDETGSFGEKKTPQELADMDISDMAAKVYACLEEEPVDVSELLNTTGLRIQEILQAMTELEINDLVRALPGKRFVRI